MSAANIDVAHQDKYQPGVGRLRRRLWDQIKQGKQMNRFESVTKPLMWSMALLLATFVAGCGDGGSDPILGGGGVTAALVPTVTATVPLAATPIVTGVAINSKITATFTKDMAPATLSTSTFVLACPAGTTVDGTVAYVAASRVATFSPAAPLPAGTICTATITTGAQDAAGVALANAFIWRFTTGATADTTRPAVTLTVPADGATDVATNTKIAATFSEGMDPATITGTTFTLTGPGATAVAGTVSYVAGARTAAFTPTTPATLPASTLFTATITTGGTDLAGNALALDKVWTFTTGTAPDTTAPTVILVNPADLATGVAINSAVNATFSEAMDPSTISTASFTLQASSTPSGPILAGTVAYDPLTDIATFTPSDNLAVNTTYTATVLTGTADVTGNALAVNKAWSFTTAATSAIPPAVNLLSVAPFGAAGGAGVTSCGPTLINGDVSTTSASTLITGLTDGNGLGNPYTIAGCPGIVNGKIYTAPPAPGDAASMAIATQAQTDAQTAFDATSTASMPGGVTQTAELGALTLAPGVYWSGTSFSITLVDLTLDAQGDPNATWVFQSDSTLTVGANRKVILTNGAQAKNIFWHVSSAATVNAGAQMKGTILAFSGVSMGTGATLDGRAISLVGGPVTLLSNIINVPAP